MRPVRTLPDALAVAAQTQASYVFVGSGVDRQRPLADIYQAALRVAASLTALGLRRGDLVALIIADAESFLTALYGASIAGVRTLPAATRYCVDGVELLLGAPFEVVPFL